jgi:hypothetical protein
MNKKIKFLIYPLIVLGLMAGGAVLWNSRIVKAGYENGKGEMAQNLAKKLNVSEEQITTAMNQVREEKRTQAQEQVNANLDKAVSEGAITAEQKQTLVQKREEIQKREQEERTADQKWQDESGIDFSKLKSYGVGGVGFGGKGEARGRGPGPGDCCDN